MASPSRVQPFDVTEIIVDSLTQPAAAEVPAIDATTPAANVASRDNIVPDGPGTVADYL